MKDSPAEPLSAEASTVMSRLPDLSFMHSKVLMFPVSDCANWADICYQTVIRRMDTKQQMLKSIDNVMHNVDT